MAVAVPPPPSNKLDFWGQSNSAAYPLKSTEPMTDIMSYQYPPPPPPNGADMDIPPSGYMSNYSMPPQSSGMDMRPSPDASMNLERRDSMSKSLKLKRSISTPDVRPQQPGLPPPQTPIPEQSSLALSAEKRRNKLGYHRTSVACGHCRRRKIRCIPSPADVQGRCVNCIRLKKECSFYPVDQQPPTDTRQKSASRSSVGPKIASASSSPAISSGHPSDMHSQQPYSQMTMPSIQNMAPPSMKPPGSDNYPPDAKMHTNASSSRTYPEYGAPGMTNWMAPEASPSSSKPGDLNATWRTYPHESPITPAFSPYTPHAPPPSASWTPVSGDSREDMAAWSSYPPPPPRSLSFGAEGMSGHSQQYPPISHLTSQPGRSYDRKSSGPMSADMYPPPIATTIPGVDSIPGTTMEHNMSLSAGAVPPPNYGSWQQSYSYSKPTEGYGGWYGENGSSQAPMASGENVQPQMDHHDPYYGGR